jgi:hypothetical protein
MFSPEECSTFNPVEIAFEGNSTTTFPSNSDIFSRVAKSFNQDQRQHGDTK